MSGWGGSSSSGGFGGGGGGFGTYSSGGFGGSSQGSSNANANANANPNKSLCVDKSPSQAISALRFSPTLDALAVSSWDGTVSAYRYNHQGVTPANRTQQQKPVLDVAWDQNGRVFSAGCDSMVRGWDVQSGKSVDVGKHDSPVRCVLTVEGKVISGSWDGSVRVWDPASPGKEMFKLDCNAKVFCMSQDKMHVGVGLSNRKVRIYDLRKLPQHLYEETTQLKNQLRCLDLFPSHTCRDQGYAAASVEGRTSVVFLTGDKKRTFSFKCHRHARERERNSSDVFGVNCLRFHQQCGTFITGGSDGEMNVWDMHKRQRIKHFHRMPLPVVALDFDRTGMKLAYGVSYDWGQGEKAFQNKKGVQLYLHPIEKSDVWSS